MKKVGLTIGALALAISPVAASAVEGSQLTRASAPVEGEEVSGGSSVFLAILAAAAVVGGIIVIADDDNDDLPVSA